MIIDIVIRLKTRVRRHGRYSVIAERAGLSLSFVEKFASSELTGYHTHAISKLEKYFAEQRAERKSARR